MKHALALISIFALLAGCGGSSDQGADSGDPFAAEQQAAMESRGGDQPGNPACDAGNGGITLPDGFCASVYADGLGPLRHITVDESGRVYAILSSLQDGAGLVALRDADGDGRSDETQRFGELTGTGALVHDGWLYASSNTEVYRFRLPDSGLAPEGEPELVVGGFPDQGSHAAKSLAIGDGSLFVNVGAPSNACMEQSRTKGSPGMDPCPLLEEHGGIWRFAADETGQQFSAQARYATGLRNSVAVAWNPAVGELYVAQHGRDQLSQFFPQFFTDQENAELPAEELFRVSEGDDFGWPYCYYDHLQNKRVLMPEYGGNGKMVGRCRDYERPVMAFPGHWAPNGLAFYDADAFPRRYHDGAFVAFHGSWNRAPEPQAGYRVVFVPLDGGDAADGYDTFANGFAGSDRIAAPGQAEYRPMGLAVGPDGELYIGETEKGRIWRVVFTGET